MIRRWLLPTLARLGETDQVEQAFAQLDEKERDDAQMRIALAWVQRHPEATCGAVAALAPVLDGSAPVASAGVDGLHAFLLEAIARDMLGETQASKRALERALDLAEPDGMRWAFLLHPTRELLERHRHGGTTHARVRVGPAGYAVRFVIASPHPRTRRTSGTTQRERAASAPVPAQQPLCARNRRRAVRFDEHGQDAHAPHLREARSARTQQGRGSRSRACVARSRRHAPPLAIHPIRMMHVHLLPDDAQSMNRAGGSNLYEFHVRGELSERILAAFGDLQATKREGETVLIGQVPDQAALFGVLDRIESLGIQLIEVRRAKPDSERTALTTPS